MARLLMVLGQAPFPRQDSGFTVRMNPIFKYLAERHDLDLIVACDEREQRAMHADEARQHAHRVVEFTAPRNTTTVRKAKTMIGVATPGRAPHKLLRPWTPDLATLVGEEIARTNYRAVHWVQLSDAAMLLIYRLQERPRFTIDWVDSMALYAHRDALRMVGGLPRRIANLRVRQLAKWERRVTSALDGAIYIANMDAEFATGVSNSKVHVIANGVVGPPGEFLRVKTPPAPSVGFLGNMAYRSNIDAALRLHGIFKRLKVEIPDLQLRIIGRYPSAEIKSLYGPDVLVTGAVDSIWPYLAETTVFCFPMTRGSGLQNKVLETLSAERAVVLSPICFAGLKVEGAAEAVVTANTDEEFAQALLDLLRSPERRREIGARGRAYVQQYSWPSLLAEYERIVLGAEVGGAG